VHHRLGVHSGEREGGDEGDEVRCGIEGQGVKLLGSHLRARSAREEGRRNTILTIIEGMMITKPRSEIKRPILSVLVVPSGRLVGVGGGDGGGGVHRRAHCSSGRKGRRWSPPARGQASPTLGGG
jgi:hypothetical protein